MAQGIAAKWQALVDLAATKGLERGAYTVPRGLQWARKASPQHEIQLRPPPASYVALLEAIGGCPVFGLCYYDRDGWSFLSPSAQEVLSTDLPTPDDVWPEADDAGVIRCPFVFFAGVELSDIEGWAFGPDPARGDTIVWEVEGGMPRTPAGPFEAWFDQRLDEALDRIGSAGEAELSGWREALAKEDDPHRLIDYSIERRLGDIDQRTDVDRALVWVVDPSTRPYCYGLWDTQQSRWRIEPRPMYRVSPFTRGVAEVIFGEEGSSYGGPWVRIDPQGTRQ
ncbi:hypothetical protein [Paraliomyxa miuraensis]|uniref:hypothetical protein n=1 Tax=Paraliomyxa miuraensis TaxID=376150 RepID=UPI0022527578|nr:hypothetical protein [Paraliomyxa miuraensis]MCX4247373.1 hypothetical protein [Paraliomyxa miuraensis]